MALQGQGRSVGGAGGAAEQVVTHAQVRTPPDGPPGNKNASAREVRKRRSQKEAGLAALVTEVRRVLSLHVDVRDRVLARFRLAGGDLRRWLRPDAVAMADSITAEEDDLEARGARHDGTRAALRALRRRLEWELFA